MTHLRAKLTAAVLAVVATLVVAASAPVEQDRAAAVSWKSCETSAQVLVLQHETHYGWSNWGNWGNAFPPGTYVGNMEVCPGSVEWWR